MKKLFLITLTAVLLTVSATQPAAAAVVPAAEQENTSVITTGIQEYVKQNLAKSFVAEEMDVPVYKRYINTMKPDVFYGFKDIPVVRKKIVDTACSMQGTVTYKLGSKPDYENDWQIGESLDCSGFVEYVYYMAAGIDIGDGTWIQSTGNIESGNAVYISHDELLPGDLAFLYDGNETVKKDESGNFITVMNHVGIYVGKDAQGNDLWCHCNAKDNTIAVNSVDYWTRYMRIKAVDSDMED